MNTLQKMFAFIIAVLLLYIVPSLFSYLNQDELSEKISYPAVTTFVDSVRNKGYVSPQMYNEFVDEINHGTYVYDVQLLHQSKVYNPVYTDPTNPLTFQGTYNVDYEEYYTKQILEVLFPNNTLPDDDPSRLYKMHVGDFFKVVIKNKNRTNATVVKDFLTFGMTGDPTVIYIPYGGMIHNEDH
ncbi:hypothetical protein ACFSCX_06530 [Bacillus salitolerans]|uniref:Uncharacterized protein n=1 Tax=Bacillus salitolerans TaxID=1437434 RepID=A0ABW4LM52_9BACI